MERIVRVHYPDLEGTLIERCMERFYELRRLDGLRKKPSTSELVDWIGALSRAGVSEERLTDELPFIGTLIKKEQDLEALARPRRR